MGSEDFLTWEFVHALGGQTPKGWVETFAWKKRGGLKALLSGEGSVNIPKLAHETARLHGEKDGDEFWKVVLDAESRAFMISEFGSHIYRDWHLLATASAIGSK